MIADPSAFFPFGRFGDIRELAPISMGLSGSGVYSVTTSRGEFILRVQGGDRAAWARSVAMQRLAAKEGIAPPVVHVVEDRAGVVYAKVEAITLGAVLAKPTIRPLALSDLAQRLAVLHAIPLSSGPEFTRELAESLWQSQVGRPGFPSWAIALGKRLVEACSMVAASPRRVFSHGDLHPANILWDGARIWLVDWERAGLAHPYSDLATLANFLTMPEDAALSLLGAQEGTAIDVDGQGMFRAVRDRNRIVYGAVFLSLVSDLTAVSIARREETPGLTELYPRMAAGTLSPGTAQCQALIGAALLKQCELRHPQASTRTSHG